MKSKNILLGVPMNLGANRSGIEFSIDVLKEKFPEIFEKMEVIPVEKQKEDFSNKKMKYKNTILTACELLARKVADEIDKGNRPIVIGGDHSIALGTVSGVVKTEENLGILWIDAHGDMNTDQITMSGNIHGMPLAMLQGYGDKDMTNCFGQNAKIKSENVVILGARDLDTKEEELINKLNIKYITCEKAKSKGIEETLREIKEYLKVEKLHVSFDIDSLDPKSAPGVSTPVKNGFTVEEIVKTFEYVFENYKITSVDIVEFNPVNDEEEKTASLVKKLVEVIDKY